MLANVEDVKRFLDKKSNSEDSVILMLLEGVSEQISDRVGSVIESSDVTEYHNPIQGSTGIVLRNPVISILSVTEGNTSLVFSQYRMEGKTIRRTNTSGFAVDWSTSEVSVRYRAGYASVPSDLRMATIIQTAFAYKQSAGGGGRLGLDSNSPSEAGESVSYSGFDLLPAVERVVDRRRW